MIDPALAERAHRLGVLSSWITVDGRHVDVDPAIVTRLVDALGDGPADHPFSVVVAWDGVLPVLPDDLAVRLEHGGSPEAGRLLPFGYHPLHRGDEPIGTVISAPRSAPVSRPGRWGVFLPLYSLRTEHTSGIATFGDLRMLFDWLHEHGGDVVLTLPLLPLYLDDPADWSPYSPVTRRMWSELYVDLDAAGAPPALPAPDPVDDLLDYPAVHAHHTRRLDVLAERLAEDPQLAQWRRDHPLADAYAGFRGAQAVHGRNFRAWQVPRSRVLADADPVIVRRHLVGSWLADRQLAAVADAARLQGQVLALDVALGAHADGFDVWHERDLFVPGMSVGAPPDPIFLGGQDWGFPPVHPGRSRATGHRYLRETLRHHLRHAGIVRLDHVMGLARQWWVPVGSPATDATYVRYPLDELFAVVCLEAHLAGSVIVGENLGTVPPEVTEGMREHGLLGLHVGQDALPSYGTDGMRRAGPGTMSMLSTHDGVPFASFWRGGDIERAHRFGLITDDDLHRALDDRSHVRQRAVDQLVHDGRLTAPDEPLTAIVSAVAEELATQPAEILTVNLEDFWLEDRAQNAPGTFQEEPNWRRVAARTIEDFRADERVSAMADRIDRARASSDMARNASDVARNASDVARTASDVARTASDVARTASDVARTASDVEGER